MATRLGDMPEAIAALNRAVENMQRQQLETQVERLVDLEMISILVLATKNPLALKQAFIALNSGTQAAHTVRLAAIPADEPENREIVRTTAGRRTSYWLEVIEHAIEVHGADEE